MDVKYDQGYKDYKAGMNSTGRNDDYDEGWIRAYQESNNIFWTKHKQKKTAAKESVKAAVKKLQGS